MDETMPTYSLVLMLAVALTYPLAFWRWRPAPRASPQDAQKIGAVTLPFALVCWYLAARWAAAPRPAVASLVGVVISLALFAAAYARWQPLPGLDRRRLALTLSALLGYAAMAWAETMIWSALNGASLDGQALMLGYLLLVPAIAWALLPRPRPLDGGLLVVLGALMLYAIGASASSAFWGALELTPDSPPPVLEAVAWLVPLAVLAWLVLRAAGVPLRAAAGRAAARLADGCRRLFTVVLPGIGRKILATGPWLGDRVRSTLRWIVECLIPDVVMGLSITGLRFAWLLVDLGQALRAAIKAVPVLLVGALHRLSRGAIWVVKTLPQAAAFAIVAIGRSFVTLFLAVIAGICHGILAAGQGVVGFFVGLVRAVGHACVWLAMVLVPAACRRLVSLGRAILALSNRLARGFLQARVWFALVLRGVGRRLVAIGRGTLAFFGRLVRAIWRACVWFALVWIPRIGRGSVAAVRGVWGGVLALSQSILHGLLAAGLAIGRATGWVVIVAVPAIGHGLVEGLGRLWRSLIAAAHRARNGLPALACAAGRAAAWLVTGAIPGIAFGLLAVARAIPQRFLDSMRAIRRGLLSAMAALRRAGRWVVVAAPPAIGHAMVRVATAIVRGALSAARWAGRAVWWVMIGLPVSLARATGAMARGAARRLAGLRTQIADALVRSVTILVPAFARRVIAATRGVAASSLRLGRAIAARAPAPARRTAMAWGFLPALLLGILLLGQVDPVREWLGQVFLPPPPPPTLHMVAGSGFKTFEPILKRWGQQNQVDVQVTYKGSLDIKLMLEDGSIHYDAIWEGDSLWTTIGDKQHLVADSQSIMCSPIVFGVKWSLADRLGWIENRNVRMPDILSAAESTRMRVLMTSATQSNSGASAYFGFLYAFAGNPDLLTEQHLADPAVQDKVKRILGTIDRTSESSGWLRDFCRDHYDKCDAMFNYESHILEMNQQLIARGDEPMYIVYPAEGLGMADFPLSFVRKGDGQMGDGQKEALFRKLQDYLRSDAVQSEIAAKGRRVGPTCARVDPTIFRTDWGADATRTIHSFKYPNEQVIRNALDLYQTTFRKASFTIYLLDYSPSMNGAGQVQLQAAMRTLLDQQEAARYLLQGSPDDVTIVIPFAGRTLNDESVENWTVSGNDPEQLQRLLGKIQEQPTADLTNIYMPVAQALSLMQAQGIGDRLPAIILMTDGASNRGSIDDVKRAVAESGLYNVPIYGITFGEASTAQLNELADLTAGRVFDGTKDLVGAFRTAKGQN
jgi:Ca-activated chloride channel family protein